MKQILFFLCHVVIGAQIPSYYSSVNFTLSPSEVKEELANLVTVTHSTELIYTPDVWNALKLADLDPDNTNNVFLIYGYNDSDEITFNDRTRDKTLSCHTNSCAGKWVREHTYPKSLGTPTFDVEGPGADAHHIRAIDSQFNNTRSNRKYADGTGDAAVTSAGNFYPGDEWKGDIARMMMYMYIRYNSRCLPGNVSVSSNNYSVEMPDIFLEWNAEDPVSAYELQRNDVLQNMQGNRNPFIDNPYLATYIWGGPEANNTWIELGIDSLDLKQFTLAPNPTKGKIEVYGEGVKSLEVLDLSGKLIAKSDHNKIDLSQKPNGIYVVKIYVNNHRFITKKIIKK